MVVLLAGGVIVSQGAIPAIQPPEVNPKPALVLRRVSKIGGMDNEMVERDHPPSRKTGGAVVPLPIVISSASWPLRVCAPDSHCS